MPNGMLTYQRGEIRWVKLDTTIGSDNYWEQIQEALSIVCGFSV